MEKCKMKKFLSVLATIVILGSTVPSYACCHEGCIHENNGMRTEQKIHPKHEPKIPEIQKPPRHKDSQVSKVIKGAAAGAILASLLN